MKLISSQKMYNVPLNSNDDDEDIHKQLIETYESYIIDFVTNMEINNINGKDIIIQYKLEKNFKEFSDIIIYIMKIFNEKIDYSKADKITCYFMSMDDNNFHNFINNIFFKQRLKYTIVTHVQEPLYILKQT